VDVIKQLWVIWVDIRIYQGGKLEFLSHTYSLLRIGKSIVFVGTKRDTARVHRTFSDSGYSCSVLHGGVSPEDRDITMQAFHDGESTVLITTNVLASGVDVDNVMMAVNYNVQVDKDGDPDFKTHYTELDAQDILGAMGRP
jgi:ATP-dependent RNA helicase DDX19/DBP5